MSVQVQLPRKSFFQSYFHGFDCEYDSFDVEVKTYVMQFSSLT